MVVYPMFCEVSYISSWLALGFLVAINTVGWDPYRTASLQAELVREQPKRFPRKRVARVCVAPLREVPWAVWICWICLYERYYLYVEALHLRGVFFCVFLLQKKRAAAKYVDHVY